MSEQISLALIQEQPAPGSHEALHQAVDAAREATQAAQAVGASHIVHAENTDPPHPFAHTTESMKTGEVYGWDSPALHVQHGIQEVITTTAKTSFVDRGRQQKVEYEVYDRDDPGLEKLLADRPRDPAMWAKLGYTHPIPLRPLGTIRRVAGNGEVLSERKIYRPETARRLATTIANQVTRRAEAAHSAKLAPRRAPRRSQFS